MRVSYSVQKVSHEGQLLDCGCIVPAGGSDGKVRKHRSVLVVEHAQVVEALYDSIVTRYVCAF